MIGLYLFGLMVLYDSRWDPVIIISSKSTRWLWVWIEAIVFSFFPFLSLMSSLVSYLGCVASTWRVYSLYICVFCYLEALMMGGDGDTWELEAVSWVRSNGNANTRRAYDGAFGGFVKFCNEFGRVALPAAPATVVMYMRHLLQEGKGRSTVLGAVAAISSNHALLGVASPTRSGLVAQAKKVVFRQTAAPRQKKALDVMLLLRFTEVLRNEFVDVRDYFMVLLASAGMLRQHVLPAFLSHDLKLASFAGRMVLSVFIETDKTDQRRVGHTVLLGSNSNPRICPVSWFRVYTSKRRPSERFFFHGVTPLVDEKAMASSTLYGRLKGLLRRVGEDPSLFGSHSCRRFGATRAANMGISRQLIASHGNWVPGSTSLELYIDDSVSNQLSVADAILSRDHSQVLRFLP